MIKTDGGVCAPKGFQAAGVHCGFRKNKRRNDLSLISSDVMCTVAAVYTTNKVYGAPIRVTRAHIADGYAKAIICNSGYANTCAPNGVEIANMTCDLTATALGCKSEDIIVASTGVIGMELDKKLFIDGIPKVAKKLNYNGAYDAATGIMTTDTLNKEVAFTFMLGDKRCTIGAMAKGSGMIHPNMATTLTFITTDVAISHGMLQKALSEDIKDSLNQISVDGDTSTNDMCVVMANGLAENIEIVEEGDEFTTFCEALYKVTSYIAQRLAMDGEGASKLVTCQCINVCSKEIARKISKSVISSNLLKAAMYGEDANWGRIICAVGYTPGSFSVENVDIFIKSEYGEIQVCKGSSYFPYSEDDASDILSANKITIIVDMHEGEEKSTAWGCDLTFEYVRINGDYRS